MEVWTGINLVQAVDPVRAHDFFGFWGCFRVWRDMIRGGGLVDQDWW